MNRIDYDALEGVNFSTAKEILRSPAHYQAALAAKGEETEEDRLRFAIGSGVHSLVLENKRLADIHAVKPEGMSFATKEGKLWRETQTLPVISADAAATIQNASAAVLAHPLAAAILGLCPEREHGLQADVEGVLCKGLIDAIGRDASGSPVIVDLKTTRCAMPRDFRRKVEWDFHYDMQAAMYKALARECDKGECEALWIVVETEAPYAVMVYQCGPELRSSGERKLAQVLQLWKDCTASGNWYGYQEVPSLQEL